METAQLEQLEEKPSLPYYQAPKSSADWVPYFNYELEPRYKDIPENFRLAFQRVPPWIPLPKPFTTLSTDFTKDRKRRGVKASATLHTLFVLMVAFSPFRDKFDELTPEQENARLIYELEQANQIIYLPPLKPRGDGGKPGRGLPRPEPPQQGSTIKSPKVQFVSNPARPDNQTQTIQQEPVAPNIRLKQDIQLPNMMFASNATPIAPPPPVQSPSVKLQRAETPAPPQPAPKPLRAPVVKAEVAAPNNVAADLNLKNAPAVANPLLPLPPPPMPDPVRINAPMEAGSLEGMTGLIVAGVVPGPPAARVELPPGNREGQFSMAPGGGIGAVGGSTTSMSNSGTGGPGAGGDRSVGAGPGVSGGGGGAATRVVAVVSSSGGAGDRDGVVAAPGPAASDGLPSTIAANKIFPVEIAPRTQGKGIVINAGPQGGGGLSVYGVLRGGKISTTYLAMPNKNWTLQFSLPGRPDNTGNARTVEWNAAAKEEIAPPFPTRRFDFQRPQLTADKARMTIVLYARITETGEVQDVKVIKGVLPELDELAMAAFGQWKFRPAALDERPVGVEILVGIPASGTASSSAGPSRSSSVTLR